MNKTAPANAAAGLAITLNGKPSETRAATLAGLIAESHLKPTAVATAVNGQFIARTARETTLLSPGDTIEIVSARQGG